MATTAATTSSAVATIPNSMWRSSSPVIEEGALVILFESHNAVTYCYTERGAVFYNRHGAFPPQRHDRTALRR
ncbi:hypothetical protein PINS_up018865 [Pythium insidiosum]|nr:hypothetical protein PINS_up018865 [Pythium insidiosum]